MLGQASDGRGLERQKGREKKGRKKELTSHSIPLPLTLGLIKDDHLTKLLPHIPLMLLSDSLEALERRLVVVERLAVRVMEVRVLGDVELLVAVRLTEAAELELDGEGRGRGQRQEGEAHEVVHCYGLFGVCLLGRGGVS